MKISSIVAASENNAIGKDGGMPWHLPDDLAFFKKHTSGHPVIMGRKTFDTLGKPLRNRANLVLTRDVNFQVDGAEIFHDIEQAIEKAKQLDSEEIFIIGGANIYKQSMDYCDRIYLTRVHSTFEGDAFFPELNMDEWETVYEEFHAKDERHAAAFTFYILERR